MKLRRYQGNPLIEPRGDDWESLATFNCAALYKDGKIHVLYRAVGDYIHYASHLGYAVFDENLNLIERPEEPVFGPDLKLWEMSIEDARLTEIEGEVYLTYVTTPMPTPPGAVRRRIGLPKPPQANARTALARVEGFRHYERLGIITPYHAHERDVVLFPEKIQGNYAAIHRPSNWIAPDYPTERPAIWFTFLDGLPGRMYDHKVIMVPEQPWEGEKIGAGPPPLKTEAGWLLIYHGVAPDRSYRAGAALLDLEEPWKVIARTPQPILEPEKTYEQEGDVPNVVFPEGIAVIADELLVFYGGADKVCCVASTPLDELINYLLTQRSDL
ncbi:MAG: glycosidase [Chloroflexi bacterium]|nr:glycosidase [Chloroflexota bacterium]